MPAPENQKNQKNRPASGKPAARKAPPRSQVRLVLVRPNGHRSEATLRGLPDHVLQAAEALLEAMSTPDPEYRAD